MRKSMALCPFLRHCVPLFFCLFFPFFVTFFEVMMTMLLCPFLRHCVPLFFFVWFSTIFCNFYEDDDDDVALSFSKACAPLFFSLFFPLFCVTFMRMMMTMLLCPFLRHVPHCGLITCRLLPLPKLPKTQCQPFYFWRWYGPGTSIVFRSSIRLLVPKSQWQPFHYWCWNGPWSERNFWERGIFNETSFSWTTGLEVEDWTQFSCSSSNKAPTL